MSLAYFLWFCFSSPFGCWAWSRNCDTEAISERFFSAVEHSASHMPGKSPPLCYNPLFFSLLFPNTSFVCLTSESPSSCLSLPSSWQPCIARLAAGLMSLLPSVGKFLVIGLRPHFEPFLHIKHFPCSRSYWVGPECLGDQAGDRLTVLWVQPSSPVLFSASASSCSYSGFSFGHFVKARRWTLLTGLQGKLEGPNTSPDHTAAAGWSAGVLTDRCTCVG